MASRAASPRDRTRKKWSPRSVNYMLSLLTAVLEDQMQQGRATRNVARLLARIPASPKPPDTLTAAEVEKILKHIETDRDAIAWQLALTGLRRGEIAGLRWSDVDLDADTLTVRRIESATARPSSRARRSRAPVAACCRYQTGSPRRCGPRNGSRLPTASPSVRRTARVATLWSMKPASRSRPPR